MPSITFNFSAQAATRIQEAVDFWNTQQGTGFTSKEFLIQHIREVVKGLLVQKRESTNAADLATETETIESEVDIA